MLDSVRQRIYPLITAVTLPFVAGCGAPVEGPDLRGLTNNQRTEVEILLHQGKNDEAEQKTLIYKICKEVFAKQDKQVMPEQEAEMAKLLDRNLSSYERTDEEIVRQRALSFYQDISKYNDFIDQKESLTDTEKAWFKKFTFNDIAFYQAQKFIDSYIEFKESVEQNETLSPDQQKEILSLFSSQAFQLVMLWKEPLRDYLIPNSTYRLDLFKELYNQLQQGDIDYPTLIDQLAKALSIPNKLKELQPCISQEEYNIVQLLLLNLEFDRADRLLDLFDQRGQAERDEVYRETDFIIETFKRKLGIEVFGEQQYYDLFPF